jgi:hypothetical protein
MLSENLFISASVISAEVFSEDMHLQFICGTNSILSYLQLNHYLYRAPQPQKSESFGTIFTSLYPVNCLCSM